MTPPYNRIRSLASDYRASELLAAAAARTAAEVLARGEPISVVAIHEHVDRYRLLLLDALTGVDGRR